MAAGNPFLSVPSSGLALCRIWGCGSCWVESNKDPGADSGLGTLNGDSNV